MEDPLDFLDTPPREPTVDPPPLEGHGRLSETSTVEVGGYHVLGGGATK